MAFRRLFCSISGEDFSIIRKGTPALKNRFAAIGLFVGFIFMLCFASFILVFTNLFPVQHILGLFVAIFFAWMITNIYLLLLYTLSKNVLCNTSTKKSLFVPNLIKYGFIVFIAILVAKPLEVLIFDSSLTNDLTQYKKSLLEKYVALTNNYYDQETTLLREIIEKERINAIKSEYNLSQVNQYEEILKENKKNQQRLVKRMQDLISRSNFYTQGIIILCTKYPQSWLCTLFIIGIFLAPALLKNFIPEKDEYYQLKKDIETRLVREEYSNFKGRFNQIMQRNHHSEYTWVELYEDPPFNTLRKTEQRLVKSEKELLDFLYHA